MQQAKEEDKPGSYYKDMQMQQLKEAADRTNMVQLPDHKLTPAELIDIWFGHSKYAQVGLVMVAVAVYSAEGSMCNEDMDPSAGASYGYQSAETAGRDVTTTVWQVHRDVTGADA